MYALCYCYDISDFPLICLLLLYLGGEADEYSYAAAV